MNDYKLVNQTQKGQIIGILTLIARAAPWDLSTPSDPALVTSEGSSASNFIRISCDIHIKLKTVIETKAKYMPSLADQAGARLQL